MVISGCWQCSAGAREKRRFSVGAVRHWMPFKQPRPGHGGDVAISPRRFPGKVVDDAETDLCWDDATIHLADAVTAPRLQDDMIPEHLVHGHGQVMGESWACGQQRDSRAQSPSGSRNGGQRAIAHSHRHWGNHCVGPPFRSDHAMIPGKPARRRIQLRQAAALGSSGISLRIAFHSLLAVTAWWVYECILGNIRVSGYGFEGWTGFPMHHHHWTDHGGPFIDHSEENQTAIRWNAIVCVGSTVLMGMMLCIIGRFAFRKPAADPPEA